MQISLAKKGQMVTGLIGIVIVLIVIIAVAFPLISSSISTTAAGSTIANTVNVVISNTNGTLNSTGANIFINKYVNTNYTVFNNVSKVNLSATVPSTDFVKLYINGTATTTSYIKAKVTNDSHANMFLVISVYPLSFAFHCLLKVSSSDELGYYQQCCKCKEDKYETKYR